jgi:hypothetical protein
MSPGVLYSAGFPGRRLEPVRKPELRQILSHVVDRQLQFTPVER